MPILSAVYGSCEIAALVMRGWPAYEAIADVLPTRLTFYESWLTPEGLRDGTIGLAPPLCGAQFSARGCGHARVTAAAGTYAADWTVASCPPWRNWIRMLPRPLRRRAVCGVPRQSCATVTRVTR